MTNTKLAGPNVSDNDLVRTKTHVKNVIVLADTTPFKLLYMKHYGLSKDFFNLVKGESKLDVKTRSKKRTKSMLSAKSKN